MDENMDLFDLIIMVMKFAFHGFINAILIFWEHNNVVFRHHFGHVKLMISCLSMYEMLPLLLSLFVYNIKESKWARYLDYINTIRRYMDILSPIGYPLCIVVQRLLRFLRRCCILYVIWYVTLSILCFTISDSVVMQYQKFFISNFTYNNSLLRSNTPPSYEEPLFENTACIMTRTLDLESDNILRYKKHKTFNCDIDIDNKTMQNVRVQFKSPGEFAKLHCVIVIPHASFLYGLKVEWKKDNRMIHANNQTLKIKTNISNEIMESSLIIPFIREEDYGIYMCQIKRKIRYGQYYIKGIQTIPLMLQTVIYTNLYSKHILKRYSGIQDVIFVPLGNHLQIIWYPLSFGIESENITQTYFINGKETAMIKKERDERQACSFVISMFSFCGYIRDWCMLYMPCSRWDFVSNSPDYTLSILSMCADTSVYGIHTIEYKRLVYNKETNTLVNVTVRHPDTIIVLPDHPYLTEMDNHSKFEKVTKLMRQLMSDDLMKEKFQDESHVVSLITRYYNETIAFFIIPLVLYGFVVYINKMGSICPYTLELIRKPYRYTCYIFCCDEDKEYVTSQLYNKLLEDNINAGIILNNCELNNPGRNNFEITADIIDNSFCLVFFVTPAYLDDKYCKNYHLIPVMQNITTGNIFANNMLCIMSENTVFPNDISLNIPTVLKVPWETSNLYHQTYGIVKRWLPKEIVRFPGTSFIESFSLVARKKIC